jgi:copper chaperone NosL
MMSRRACILFAAAALLAGAAFFLPLWNVFLQAPQYPEGLGMRIRVNTVTGIKPNDLANINNLNHYIGMRRIEPDAIPELRIMPYALGALILAGLATAWSGRRRLGVAWAVGFVLLALVGLVDFWKWEYDYGHNLDLENAIIKVPGMNYQPPLIGSKQLLNFRATSLPGSGTWVLLVSLWMGIVALAMDRRRGGAIESARAHAAAISQVA